MLSLLLLMETSMKAQKGFTLIELMIVVAIIGILAAIAIPQYQNYVGRSNFAAGLSTVNALKTNIEDYVLNEGAFPAGTLDANAESPANTTPLGKIGAVSTDLGKLVLAASGTAGGGTAALTFAKGNPGIKGKVITLTRTDEGSWTCSTDADEVYVKGCTVAE